MTEEPKAKLEATLAKANVELGERGIVPKNLDEAFRVSQAIQRSGLAPQSLSTPEKILVAMMAGMELGFHPMTALRSMYVIGGMPSLYGEAALALVRQSGLMEDFSKETIRDDKGEPVEVRVTSKRKGTSTALVTTFTRKQAEKAGLWGGTNPNWKSRPDVMMGWRAIGQHIKDQYPDVTRGLPIAENLEPHEIRRVTATSPTTTLAAKTSGDDPLLRMVDAEISDQEGEGAPASATPPEEPNGDAPSPPDEKPDKKQVEALRKLAAHVIGEAEPRTESGDNYTPRSLVEEITGKKIEAMNLDDLEKAKEALDDMMKAGVA